MSVQGTNKNIYGFDPRSIGGCVTWLDGADSNTVFSDTSGTVVANTNGPVRYWRDKSGFSNHFSNFSANTSLYYPTRTSTGGVFISNGTGTGYNASTYRCLKSINTYFTFPYYTAFSVASFAQTSSGQFALQTLLQVPRSATTESRNPQWGVGGNFAIGATVPWAVSNSRWSVGDYVGGSYAESPPANTVSVMALTSGTLSNASYVAGVQVSSGTGTLYVPWTVNGVSPTIGGGLTDGRWTSSGTYFETLVYNCELTARQREEVEGYLSWKWNRQAALDTTHPFRYVPPLIRAFNPLDVANCILWLDASDATTITGSTPVTQWLDKSGLEYFFSGTGAVLSNIPTSPLPTLYFDGSSYLTNNSMSIPNPFTVFTVGYQTLNTSSYQRILNGVSGASYDGLLFVGVLASSVAVFIGNGPNWNDFNANVPNTNALSTTMITAATIVVSNVTTYANGTLLDSKTGAGTTPTLTGLNVGGGYGNLTIGNQPWNGHIAEILVYSGTLTNSQRIQVEGYLARKWGPTLSAHSFSVFPTGSVSKFKPTDFKGCALWFDATDPLGSGNASTTTSVSTWFDKSGMGSNATVVGTVNMVSNAINNLPGVYFTGGSSTGYFTGTTSNVGTTMSLFVVVHPLTPVGIRIFSFAVPGAGDSTTNNAAYGFLGYDGTSFAAYRGFSNIVGSGDPNTPYIISLVWDGTQGSIYLNGYLTDFIYLSSSFGYTSFAIGINNRPSLAPQVFNGYLGELVLFNTALQTQERQEMEGYLAWKWLIQK